MINLKLEIQITNHEEILKNNVSGKMFVDVLDTLKLLDKKKKIENKVEEKIKSKLIDKLSKELKKEGVKSKIKIY